MLEEFKESKQTSPQEGVVLVEIKEASKKETGNSKYLFLKMEVTNFDINKEVVHVNLFKKSYHIGIEEISVFLGAKKISELVGKVFYAELGVNASNFQIITALLYKVEADKLFYDPREEYKNTTTIELDDDDIFF